MKDVEVPCRIMLEQVVNNVRFWTTDEKNEGLKSGMIQIFENLMNQDTQHDFIRKCVRRSESAMEDIKEGTFGKPAYFRQESIELE